MSQWNTFMSICLSLTELSGRSVGYFTELRTCCACQQIECTNTSALHTCHTHKSFSPCAPKVGFKSVCSHACDLQKVQKYIDAGYHPDKARDKEVSSPIISTTVGVGIGTQFRICASQCACHFFESRVHGPALAWGSGWCVGWGHKWSCVCVCVCQR